MQPVAPPSPDYVPGPEHPPSPDYVPGPEHPPSPVEIPYIPELEYTLYLVPSDTEAPLEDQSLPVDASPTAASPGYVADSDPDEDPEEDPKDDHADYLADGGDGDDEPSDDDDDDDKDEEPFKDEEDEEVEEEEEHQAPTDSYVVPIVDHVLPDGDTEALEANEPAPIPRSPHIIILLSQTRLRRAQNTVRLEPPMSASMEACIARHAALLSPPLPVPSSPLPLPSPLTTSPTDAGVPLGYKAAEIRMRALLPSTSHMTDIPKADVPPRKRACLTTLAPGFEIGESFAAGAARQPGPTLEPDLTRYRVEQTRYGITNTWDEIVDTLMEIASTTLEGVNQRVTELDTTVRQRTDEDRPDHRRTAMLLDKEDMYARKTWTGSEDKSAAIAAYVRTLEAQILEARDPEPQEGLAEAGSNCVAAALAERDADKSRNGDNSNDLGTDRRRQPMSFQGTEEVVGLTRWAVGQDVAYAMPWAALKRMITDKYCPSAKAERYIGGLPDMIHGSVKASKPQSMQEAIEFATKMMDKKILTHADRIIWHGLTLLGHEIRILMEEPNLCVPSAINTTMDPAHQSIQTVKRLVIWPMIVKADLLLPTTTTLTTTTTTREPKGQMQRESLALNLEFKEHYKSDCPKLKNRNQENRSGNGNAMARAYAVRIARTNPNSNVVT
nr:hypothetical protein [Tanacetum cinerariifolium]